MDPVTLTLALGLGGIAATALAVLATWLIARHYACQHPLPPAGGTPRSGSNHPGS